MSKPLKPILKTLKQNTAYLVKVKVSEYNVEHEAIFFMGFHSGSYCYVYTNNYEQPIPFKEYYSIKIVKELHSFKT